MPLPPLARVGLRPGPPQVDQRVPLGDFEIDLDADVGQVLLNVFVHGERLHLARARARDQDLGLHGLGLAVARLGQQLLRRLGVELHLERGLAEPRAARGDEALGRDHQPVQQHLQPLAVDREIGRLAHADVGPRRALDHAEVPGPVVRIGVAHDLEARLLQARHRVGRGRLDPVDLARAQRRGARRRLGDWQQHHLVELGHARLVPILLVGRQLGAGLRLERRHLPRAGARRRLREPCSSPCRASPIAPGSTSSPKRSGRAGRRRASWS